MTDKTLVRLENLHFAYPNSQIPIFQNFNLTINSGEFICVVGPSGCGKSTLLNLLAGYQKPTSGTLLFRGKMIEGPSWHRGVVFQNQALFPWLTVAENIAFGLESRQVEADKRDDLVQQMLEIIGLESAKERYIFELSGGMQQRVQLARVLVNQPELVLMDEPLGALDAISRSKMQNFLRQLWRQSQGTFFMITHDIDEALTLGTRILILNKDVNPVESIAVNYTNKIAQGLSSETYIDKDYLRIRHSIHKSFE